MTGRGPADPAARAVLAAETDVVRLVADGCRTWPALAREAAGCTACDELVRTRQQVVVGDPGPALVRLALVGEAPGATEDATGRPFVGRAGRLLDDVLAEAGLARADVAVLNTLKCRPPGNRRPTTAEASRCSPWLERQLGLLSPALVVALGGTAAGWFLGRGRTLASLRGEVHEGRAGSRVLVTYHPSAALRWGPAGAPRAAMVDDLRLARRLAAA